MNADIKCCVDFLIEEITKEYTKERFLAEDEFIDLQASAYRSLIDLSKEGLVKLEIKDGNLNIKVPLKA